jgi:hypothetical protein
MFFSCRITLGLIGIVLLFASGYLVGHTANTGSGRKTPRSDTALRRHPTSPSDVASDAAGLLRRYEQELQTVIAADARLMVRTHVLNGPILGATCTPMERGGAPVIASTLHFNCIAIQRRRGKTIEGARYFGSINVDTGSHFYKGD